MDKTESIMKLVLGHPNPMELILHVNDKRDIALSECTFHHAVERDGHTTYMMVGSTHDLDVVRLLPDLMLGPSTEFALLKITGTLPQSGEQFTLYGHLTSSMQNSSKVQLHIRIDEAA